MSTGIGFGVAVPQGSSDYPHWVVGYLHASQRTPWDALHHEPVTNIACCVVPQGQFKKSLQTAMTDEARASHEIAPT